MDDRKYWGFRVRSSPDAIKQRIGHLIAQNNLRARIPRMYCEKVLRQRGVHEFYFFLDITCEDDDTPYDILHRPDLLNIARVIGEEPFTFEQIKSMTGREIDLESIKYARQLVYHPPETVRPDNPFDISMMPETDVASREAYNRLLYWMSAVGKGTWQGFREACRALGLSNSAEARHIFRRLRLLGHVEYLNGGTHWTVCPSCLVNVYDYSEMRYFLSGAQVPSLIASIQDTKPVEVEIRGNHGGPESVFITFDPSSDEQPLIKLLQKDYPYFRSAGATSTKLAAILPNLDGWHHTVLSTIGVATDRYNLEKWDGESFRIAVSHPVEEGMYRLTDLVNPESDLRYYFYFDSVRNCWLQGDWYGLRFLANHHLGFAAEFKYAPELRQLYIPNAYHVPDLYERALVLASGKLPSSVSDGLVYENVDSALADMICSKLSVQLSKEV